MLVLGQVWNAFAELLRGDIARCLSRYQAVRWEQVQVQILWQDVEVWLLALSGLWYCAAVLRRC
jgi:hypothetical protein